MVGLMVVCLVGFVVILSAGFGCWFCGLIVVLVLLFVVMVFLYFVLDY